MKLSVPPEPSASQAEHKAWASSALAEIEEEVRRLSTRGLIISWTVDEGGAAWSIGAFYCLGCSRLHHEYGRQDRPGAPWRYTNA